MEPLDHAPWAIPNERLLFVRTKRLGGMGSGTGADFAVRPVFALCGDICVPLSPNPTLALRRQT